MHTLMMWQQPHFRSRCFETHTHTHMHTHTHAHTLVHTHKHVRLQLRPVSSLTLSTPRPEAIASKLIASCWGSRPSRLGKTRAMRGISSGLAPSSDATASYLCMCGCCGDAGVDFFPLLGDACLKISQRAKASEGGRSLSQRSVASVRTAAAAAPLML